MSRDDIGESHHPLLEPSPIAGDEGQLIGRDPRDISAEEFDAAGIRPKPLLKVIREKCIDCSGGFPAEVRKCVCRDCPLWSYRMARNPFGKRRGNPAALRRSREKTGDD